MVFAGRVASGTVVVGVVGTRSSTVDASSLRPPLAGSLVRSLPLVVEYLDTVRVVVSLSSVGVVRPSVGTPSRVTAVFGGRPDLVVVDDAASLVGTRPSPASLVDWSRGVSSPVVSVSARPVLASPVYRESSTVIVCRLGVLVVRSSLGGAPVEVRPVPSRGRVVFGARVISLVGPECGVDGAVMEGTRAASTV